MDLPVAYSSLDHSSRPLVRAEYVRRQKGLCWHCGGPLTEPAKDNRRVKASLFPKDFFRWPQHLHHNHHTDMTVGVTHAQCNAILWQYYGE